MIEAPKQTNALHHHHRTKVLDNYNYDYYIYY